MINRRELLKRTTIAAFAAGIPSAGVLAGCSQKSQTTSSDATELTKTKASLNAPSPLPVPPEGKLPAAFVLGKDAEVLDFTGPLEVFAGAATKDGKPLFAPYMVAATNAPVTVGGGMKVVPDYTFKTAPAPKVIVIPAMDYRGEPEEMFDWIRSASKNADVTMSVCNGAFVLAKTGLLSGKPAVCHHGAFFRFAAMYPDVHLKRGARFVEDGSVSSAGGISSGTDLAIRVVQRYLGTDAVLELADGMEYQGKGWENPNSNEAYANLPKFTEEHPLCPVCLSEADRSISSNYKGKTYHFCAKSEKDFFEKHTDTFDKLMAEDAARNGTTSRN